MSFPPDVCLWWRNISTAIQLFIHRRAHTTHQPYETSYVLPHTYRTPTKPTKQPTHLFNYSFIHLFIRSFFRSIIYYIIHSPIHLNYFTILLC